MQLIPRSQVLKESPYFAYTIIQLQDGKYNPDNSPYTPGEMVETESGTTILTEQDCIRLNREAQYEFQRRSDKVDVQDLKSAYVDELTYGLSGKIALSDYLKLLTDTYQRIMKALEIKELIFMMDYAVPWLSTSFTEGDLLPVQEKLKASGMDTKFDGAIAIHSGEFQTLVDMLFWYARYNDVFPEIHFTGEKSKTTFNLCPFANLHFNCYDKKALSSIKSIMEKTQFNRIKNEECEIKYPTLF